MELDRSGHVVRAANSGSCFTTNLRWLGPVALRLSGRHRAAFHQAASAKVLGRTGGSHLNCIQVKRHLHALKRGGFRIEVSRLVPCFRGTGGLRSGRRLSRPLRK